MSMSGDLHQEFGDLLETWAGAIVADDPDAIGSFAEPDWVLVGSGGIFPRQQFLDSVKSGDITHHTMSFEVHDVRIYGDVAVVIARGQNTGAYKEEEFQLDEWVTDVFVKRDGSWKCALSHLTAADVMPSG